MSARESMSRPSKAPPPPAGGPASPIRSPRTSRLNRRSAPPAARRSASTGSGTTEQRRGAGRSLWGSEQGSPQDEQGDAEIDDDPRHIDERGDERRRGRRRIEAQAFRDEGQDGPDQRAKGHDADQRDQDGEG